VTYKGTLDLRSAQATYDLFFFKEFHVSPGVLVYNGTTLPPTLGARRAELHVEQHQLRQRRRRSRIGTVKLTVYKSRADASRRVWQFGAPQQHFSTSFEIGAGLPGPPRVTLNLGGSACDSTGLFCRVHQLRPNHQPTSFPSKQSS